jgi:hypothetical protein
VGDDVVSCDAQRPKIIMQAKTQNVTDAGAQCREEYIHKREQEHTTGETRKLFRQDGVVS